MLRIYNSVKWRVSEIQLESGNKSFLDGLSIQSASISLSWDKERRAMEIDGYNSWQTACRLSQQ